MKSATNELKTCELSQPQHMVGSGEHEAEKMKWQSAYGFAYPLVVISQRYRLWLKACGQGQSCWLRRVVTDRLHKKFKGNRFFFFYLASKYGLASPRKSVISSFKKEILEILFLNIYEICTKNKAEREAGERVEFHPTRRKTGSIDSV
jgi:hypothetical protein